MCLSHHTTASQIYIENLLAHQHWRRDFWFQCLAHSHNHSSHTRTNSSRSFSFGVASFSCNWGWRLIPGNGELVVHINEPSELVQRHGVFRLRSCVCWRCMKEVTTSSAIYLIVFRASDYSRLKQKVFRYNRKIIFHLASISAFRLRMWVANDSDLRAKNVLTKFIHVSLRHEWKGTLSAKNRLLQSSRTHLTKLKSKNI